LGKRKRISKKELKHDALLETAAKGTKFMEEHLNKVLLGVLGVVVVVVVVMMVMRSRGASELASNAALTAAGQTMNAGLLTQAADQYRALVAQYPGTRSAGAAMCYLGTIHFREGNHAEALDHFERFLSSYRKAGNLRTIALEGKAAVLEDTRDFAAAAAAFEDLASGARDNAAASARYLANAVRCYRSAADWQSVRDVAARIIEDYPDTAPATGTAVLALSEAEAHLGL